MRRTKANQKGKSRHFSTPEEIQHQMAKIDLEDESSSAEEASGSDSDSSDDGRDSKPKGVAGLIEIENPNRMPKKPNLTEGKVELSRREREEIEKQKAKERYQKLHAEGKTDQAKADLARLALIRQKREQEAAKKREEARIREEEAKKKLQASSRKVDSSAGSSKK